MLADVRRMLRRPGARLALLGLTAFTLVGVFLFWGVAGSWEFAVAFRGRKVAAMIVVAVAIGVSTVLFQTITDNRILTPSIMGFDAVFMLIQAVVVFAFGAGTLSVADPLLRWTVQVACMIGFSLLLFRWIFTRAGRSITLLVLVGIVFGTVFRSVTALIQRMLDPASFAVLQDASFASFNRVDERLLSLTAVIVVATLAAGWWMRARLDVLVLGECRAIGLGIDHRRTVSQALVLIAVLVSVSTALVGPIAFLGLILTSLAHATIGSFRHAVVVPAAVLFGVIALVGGQLVLERVLALDSALAVVIEFTGGLLFIALLVRKGVRR